MATKIAKDRSGVSDFINEVIKTGAKIFPKEELERLRICMQCGKCVGSCPSGSKTAWRVRKLVEKTLLGLRDEVISDDDLWNCTTCYTCQERCPRGIHTTDIVRIIRNLAVQGGYIKNNHRKVCEILFKYGHAVPVNKEVREVRKALGLPEVPPTVHSDSHALEEVQKLFKDTGFKKILEEPEE